MFPQKLGLEAFAPIGLLKMFNSGGAIISLEYRLHENNDQHMEFEEKRMDILDFANSEGVTALFPVATIHMKVHGCGEFGVYSSVKPRGCLVDSRKIDILYDAGSGLVTFALPKSEEQVQDVVIEI